MKKDLILFDVDNTLTPPQKNIKKDMENILKVLYKKYDLGFVGGGSFINQKKYLKEENLKYFKYWFSENGTLSYKNKKLIHNNSFKDFLGEKNYQKLINFILKEFSKLKIPKKVGNFIELRNGVLNISPIGRSCNYDERLEFFDFDKKYKIREKFIKKINRKFKNLNLHISIGGQISIDIFPKNWDKTYCLKFVENEYKKIYFFGDKCEIGGNDFEIFGDIRIKGFEVKNYKNTIKIIKEKFL